MIDAIDSMSRYCSGHLVAPFLKPHEVMHDAAVKAKYIDNLKSIVEALEAEVAALKALLE